MNFFLYMIIILLVSVIVIIGALIGRLIQLIWDHF